MLIPFWQITNRERRITNAGDSEKANGFIRDFSKILYDYLVNTIYDERLKV